MQDGGPRMTSGDLLWNEEQLMFRARQSLQQVAELGATGCLWMPTGDITACSMYV